MDEFVWKLVNGEANEPSDFYEIRAENEKLKAQLEAVNDKSIGFLQTQLTELFNEKMPNTGKIEDSPIPVQGSPKSVWRNEGHDRAAHAVDW